MTSRSPAAEVDAGAGGEEAGSAPVGREPAPALCWPAVAGGTTLARDRRMRGAALRGAVAVSLASWLTRLIRPSDRNPIADGPRGPVVYRPALRGSDAS